MKKFLLVIVVLASFLAGIITTVYFSTLANINSSDFPNVTKESHSDNSDSPKITNESSKTSKANYSNEGLSGLKIFSEKGECLETKSRVIEIDKVLKPNMALAETGKIFDAGNVDYFLSDGLEILIINYEGKHFYDKQQIKIPKGKCLRQVGIYKDYSKTVPAVVIE